MIEPRIVGPGHHRRGGPPPLCRAMNGLLMVNEDNYPSDRARFLMLSRARFTLWSIAQRLGKPLRESVPIRRAQAGVPMD